MFKIIAVSPDNVTGVLTSNGIFEEAGSFPELKLFDTTAEAEAWLRDNKNWIDSEFASSAGTIQIVTHLEPKVEEQSNAIGGRRATGLSLKVWEAVLSGNSQSIKSIVRNEGLKMKQGT